MAKERSEEKSVVFDEDSVIQRKNKVNFGFEEKVTSKVKRQINQEKLDLLKSKFNFLRKVRPLKLRKKRNGPEVKKFDRKSIDLTKTIDMSAIWEKARKDRTMEEKYYYRKEARTYHKYFFLHLSREITRTRWTPRKQLNLKFLVTVGFIAFFAALFGVLQLIILYLFKVAKIS